jgi:sn-glycerol 3-phosphate transport system permease protein
MLKIKKLPEYLIKALIILIFIFPFYWMLTTAFKTYGEAIQLPPTLVPLQATLSNFVEAWNSGPFVTYTRNTIVVTLSAMIIQLIIMVPAAYGFAKFDFKGKGLLFSIVLLALMMPKQIIFIPVYLMMAKLNLLGTLLPQIIPFAADAFGIFLLRQYFMQVPEEIIEAAHLDNASEFQIMFKILLPMAKSALVTILLFSFIGFWNSYFWPLIMTSEDSIRPLTIGISVLKDTEGIAQWNVIMAGNTILVLPIIIVYMFASRQIVKAFCYSGIK